MKQLLDKFNIPTSSLGIGDHIRSATARDIFANLMLLVWVAQVFQIANDKLPNINQTTTNILLDNKPIPTVYIGNSQPDFTVIDMPEISWWGGDWNWVEKGDDIHNEWTDTDQVAEWADELIQEIIDALPTETLDQLTTIWWELFAQMNNIVDSIPQWTIDTLWDSFNKIAADFDASSFSPNNIWDLESFAQSVDTTQLEAQLSQLTGSLEWQLWALQDSISKVENIVARMSPDTLKKIQELVVSFDGKMSVMKAGIWNDIISLLWSWVWLLITLLGLWLGYYLLVWQGSDKKFISRWNRVQNAGYAIILVVALYLHPASSDVMDSIHNAAKRMPEIEKRIIPILVGRVLWYIAFWKIRWTILTWFIFALLIPFALDTVNITYQWPKLFEKTEKPVDTYDFSPNSQEEAIRKQEHEAETAAENDRRTMEKDW